MRSLQNNTCTERSRSIPKLRFLEFSDVWKVNRLGSLCIKIGSGSTPKGGEDVYLKTGVPFIRSQNVINNTLVVNDTCISDKMNNRMKGSVVKANDILLNITGGSIGRSCVVPDDFIIGNVNQHVSIIRLKKDDSKFLQSFLSSYKGQKLIFRGQTGSGREGLNFQSIRGFKIPFPQLEEQKKIASFLTAIDKKLTQLQEKKILLEAYKKSVMQQVFNQELRFKDENGDTYPNWEEKTLGEIGVTLNGLTGKTKENFGIGKPYIQYKQIFDISKIDISNCGLVDILKNEKQTKVQFGDVFFTTSSETPNEIGTASVLLDKVDDMYLNSFCFGYRVDLKILVPKFSQFLFRSNDFRRKMIPLAQGSTRYNISRSSFVKLMVDIPSSEEQTQIANFLSAIDKKIELVNTQIKNSQQFKKGLLQQMFV